MVASRPVLVVDDDEAIRELVGLTLLDEGYGVIEAPDGAAALDLLAEHDPCLILLDMRMPTMDGWAFARAYRALDRPKVPVVVMTAAQDAAGRAAQIQAAGYIAKPFDLDALVLIVSKFARPG